MELERALILSFIETMNQVDPNRIHLYGTEHTYFENKNSKKSLAVRKQANQLFAKKNHNEKLHEEIWKLYTKSIAYATNESEELAAGYANRSALLLHLKKYSECLLDIDRALKITDSNALKVKLHCRQIECCVALQDGNEKNALAKANHWLGKVDDVKEKQRLKEMIEKTEKAMTTDKPDPVKKEKEYDISCENNALSIRYNEKYGRHLVANRDIRIGELVYVEKFYLTAINTAKFYAYCSHCLALSWATIPCDQCSFYLYCSEECKKEAWEKYHDIECAVKFGKIPEIRDSYFVQFGLRAVVMAFKEAGSIKKLKELTRKLDRCTDLEKKDLTKDGKFLGNSFNTLYSLSRATFVEIFKFFVPHIIVLLPAFAKNTNIFGKDFKYTNNVDLLNNENVIFFASLHLRLSRISLIHAFEVLSAHVKCEKGCKGFFDCMSNYCDTRGLSLSTFTSLINHSCDNNVDKFYTNDGRVVYYALKPIEKNSQVFSSYHGLRFIQINKPDRQDMLYKQFEFHCDCEACKNNWPVFFEKLPNPTALNRAMLDKHFKTFKNLILGKRYRHSTKTIRTFIQDTEILLQSTNQPDYNTYTFLLALCQIIEHRYSISLHVPKGCKNNSSK